VGSSEYSSQKGGGTRIYYCQIHGRNSPGSIPASSDTVESEKRRMKQCEIKCLKIPKKSALKNKKVKKILGVWGGGGGDLPGMEYETRVDRYPPGAGVIRTQSCYNPCRLI
jgi:hypothetical protein